MAGVVPTMKQSGVIFGSLTIAFVVYITMKGHLPQYLALITGSGAATTTTSGVTPTTSTTSNIGLSPAASPTNNVAPAQSLNIGSSTSSTSPSNNVAPTQSLNVGSTATTATTASTNLSNTGMFFPTFNQVDLFGG